MNRAISNSRRQPRHTQVAGWRYMKDIQLLAQILGLVPPWRVGRVRLDGNRAVLRIDLVSTPGHPWECPECRQPSRTLRVESRTWHHLDICQYRSVIVAEVPIIDCELHGVQLAWVPWAESNSRQTNWAERRSIEKLFGLVDDFDAGGTTPAGSP